MKSKVVKRTIKFRVYWNPDREDAEVRAVEEVDRIMKDQDYPIPFDVRSGAGYTITRMFGNKDWGG
jgi:hypothetical protein